jgi:FAD/FMN-containing dehydrogenase
VQQLNETVMQKNGRIYLTKDGLSSRDDFEKMEDRIEQFNAVRRKYDPEGHLRSAQSVRLFGF